MQGATHTAGGWLGLLFWYDIPSNRRSKRLALPVDQKSLVNDRLKSAFCFHPCPLDHPPDHPPRGIPESPASMLQSYHLIVVGLTWPSVRRTGSWRQDSMGWGGGVGAGRRPAPTPPPRHQTEVEMIETMIAQSPVGEATRYTRRLEELDRGALPEAGG